MHWIISNEKGKYSFEYMCRLLHVVVPLWITVVERAQGRRLDP